MSNVEAFNYVADTGHSSKFIFRIASQLFSTNRETESEDIKNKMDSIFAIFDSKLPGTILP